MWNWLRYAETKIRVYDTYQHTQTEGSREQRWSVLGLRRKQLQILLRCNKRDHLHSWRLYCEYIYFLKCINLSWIPLEMTTYLVWRRIAWSQQIFVSLDGFQRVWAQANRHFLCNKREWRVYTWKANIFSCCFLVFWDFDGEGFLHRDWWSSSGSKNPGEENADTLPANAAAENRMWDWSCTSIPWNSNESTSRLPKQIQREKTFQYSNVQENCCEDEEFCYLNKGYEWSSHHGKWFSCIEGGSSPLERIWNSNPANILTKPHS